MTDLRMLRILLLLVTVLFGTTTGLGFSLQPQRPLAQTISFDSPPGLERLCLAGERSLSSEVFSLSDADFHYDGCNNSDDATRIIIAATTAAQNATLSPDLLPDDSQAPPISSSTISSDTIRNELDAFSIGSGGVAARATETVVRTKRAGEKAVRITRADGSVIDVSRI